MSRVASRFLVVAMATVLATGWLTARANPVRAISPDIVLGEIYGGGGNSGATLTNDFIELFNRGASPVDVTGWSVQYASATGNTWQVTSLTGTIPAGSNYLVQEAAGAGGTTPLPTPDASGSIAMSATAGKVALVTTTTALTCATGCATLAGVRDFVGYGATASSFEGAGPAPGLSNTTSAIRAGGGATDTDNNAADFAAGSPMACNAGGDCEPAPPPPPTVADINEIQGNTHLSPLAGTTVETTGIAIAVRAFGTARGFWMQDATPDEDAATSEGIFVFTGATTPAGVAIGDAADRHGHRDRVLSRRDADHVGRLLDDGADRRHMGRGLEREQRQCREHRTNHHPERLHAGRPAAASSP